MMRVTIYSAISAGKLQINSAATAGEIILTIKNGETSYETIVVRADQLRQALVALGQ